MKLVTLTRDMAPHRAGDRYLLPDALADQLVRDGDGRDAVSFPETVAPEPPRARKYLTKGA